MKTKKSSVVTKSPDFLKKTPKAKGVTLKKDNAGYFVTTHRARSKSYASPEKIPIKVIEFIESTG